MDTASDFYQPIALAQDWVDAWNQHLYLTRRAGYVTIRKAI
ncbi:MULTISPECIES: hypothetical protein [Sphingobacterium]|nr:MULTISPECIES: hypothetical protein [Sphingobacterium]